jgi:hypothetical protein
LNNRCRRVLCIAILEKAERRQLEARAAFVEAGGEALPGPPD